MRIVLPVHHFPPRYSAGAELYTYRLARWLLEHGHEVEVITIEAIDCGSSTQINAKHDWYDGIPVWRLSFNLIAAPQRRLWEFDNELLGKWFDDYFERQRPDLAHFQAGYLLGVAPLFAAAGRQIPTLLTLHDYWYLCPQHTLQRSDGALCATVPDDPAVCARCRLWGNEPYARVGYRLPPTLRRLIENLPVGADSKLMKLRRERLRAALASVAMVIAPSQFMRRQMQHLVAPDRLVFSRIGIDTTQLNQLVKRGGDTVRFGYLGQVAQHKGVHVLVDAFQRLSVETQSAELHIWGGDEASPAYGQRLRKVAQDNPQIVFHGRYDNRRLPEILEGFDYLVAPSVWYENCPLTILEAYAASIPVICSDHGGLAELVEPGKDGLIFRPGDAADLAQAMQRVVDDADLNRRLQEGARQRNVLDIDGEMQNLMQLYAAVVQHREGVAAEYV
ncbi:MAG TPA: glycosyl transferase family 1 [Chloroflexi bacterium]|nr:glycosyl transferase family 1 [Chloroflexota bacterium]HHW87559.1 glycosyltransferase family 4 protein [Chloroflexota bacterium]